MGILRALMTASNRAIETSRLGREYRIRNAKPPDPTTLTALRDVDLHVERGELFGLLGPNGAGKTTLIKILTTLLAPTTGIARIAGFDVASQSREIRSRINMVSGGESSGYGLLTVEENLWMFSQFYGMRSGEARRRIGELLEVVGLADRRRTKCSDLSTGLRQKMNIVRGFLTDPEVLFLDEPTLGLDVGASRDVRDFVRRWMAEDPRRTLLLTTHYMVEADDLCHRVAIINRGELKACDTPANLKRRLATGVRYRMSVSPPEGTDLDFLERMPGVVRSDSTLSDGLMHLDLTLAADDALGTLLAAFDGRGIRLTNLGKHEATLEDVFVDVVGESMEAAEQPHGGD
ncbi:MAG TPA: ABC transporter ATP-binding protein [Candidatus Eisenbacteria bacterium]